MPCRQPASGAPRLTRHYGLLPPQSTHRTLCACALTPPCSGGGAPLRPHMRISAPPSFPAVWRFPFYDSVAAPAPSVGCRARRRRGRDGVSLQRGAAANGSGWLHRALPGGCGPAAGRAGGGEGWPRGDRPRRCDGAARPGSRPGSRGVGPASAAWGGWGDGAEGRWVTAPGRDSSSRPGQGPSAWQRHGMGAEGPKLALSNVLRVLLNEMVKEKPTEISRWLLQPAHREQRGQQRWSLQASVSSPVVSWSLPPRSGKCSIKS